MRKTAIVAAAILAWSAAGCRGSETVNTAGVTPTQEAGAQAVRPQLRVGDTLIAVGGTSATVTTLSDARHSRSVDLPFGHPLSDLIVQRIPSEANRQASIVGRTCDELADDGPLESDCTPGTIVAGVLDIESMTITRSASPVDGRSDVLRTSIAAVPGPRAVIQLGESGDDPAVDRVRLVERVGDRWETVVDDGQLRHGSEAIAVEACATDSSIIVKVLGSTPEVLRAMSGTAPIGIDYPRRVLTLAVVDSNGARWSSGVPDLNSELAELGCSGTGTVLAGPNASGSAVETWAVPDVERAQVWSRVDERTSIIAAPRISSSSIGVVLTYFEINPTIEVVSLSSDAARTADVTALLPVAPGSPQAAPQVPVNVPSFGSADRGLTFFDGDEFVVLERDQIRFETAK